MIFPRNFDYVNKINDDVEPNSYKKMPYFDFKKGDFKIEDGKLVLIQNEEALKLMIEKVIRTDKFKYNIYARTENDEFGSTFNYLIGKNLKTVFLTEYIRGELEKELLKLKGVDKLSNISIHREDDLLHISFSINDSFTVSEVI